MSKRRGPNSHVPVEPFQQWCARLIERWGSTEAGKRCEADPHYLKRIAEGKVGDSRAGGISIDLVDRVLIAEGSTSLWELYPVEDEAEAERQETTAA